MPNNSDLKIVFTPWACRYILNEDGTLKVSDSQKKILEDLLNNMLANLLSVTRHHQETHISDGQTAFRYFIYGNLKVIFFLQKNPPRLIIMDICLINPCR